MLGGINMSNSGSKLMLVLALAVTLLSLPASATTFYFPTSGTSRYVYDTAQWNTLSGGGGSNPTLADFANIANFFTATSKSMRCANPTDASGTFTIAAPVSYTGPMAVSNTVPAYYFYWNGPYTGSNGGMVATFNDLRFTGTMFGATTRSPYLRGKLTATGDIAFQFRSSQNLDIDAQIDASAASIIMSAYYARTDTNASVSNIRFKNSGNRFYGTYVLDARLEGRVANSLSEGDFTINGASDTAYDYRSGKLALYASNAISPSAMVKIYTKTGVSGTYTNTDPVRIDMASSGVNPTIRELWIDDVKQGTAGVPITFTTSSTWLSGTGNATGTLTVTNKATQNLTMAYVAGSPTEPNIRIYPPSGTTRAYSQGYAVPIAAATPTTSPYRFDHWTTTGGTLADPCAADTTITIPTGSDVTVTAYYVIAATNPAPLSTATNISVFTGLSWTPAAVSTQAVYFGTAAGAMTSVTSGDGTLSSVSNASIGGPLVSNTQYFWRIVSGGIDGPVWNFTTGSVKATNPSPVSGAIEVDPNRPTLTWSADASGATSFDVYFSTNQTLVANGDASVKSVVTTASFPTGVFLAKAKIYYWRVDAHYASGLTATGDVWNFTTQTYKLYLKTTTYPQPAYSIDGAADVNVANAADGNFAIYEFSTFNYGSDWDIIVTGARPISIRAASGDLVFGGKLIISGANGIPAGTGSGGGVGIAGGANGVNNSQGTYSEITNGIGHGYNSQDMQDGSGAGYGGAGGRCGRSSSVLGGQGGISYGEPELLSLYGGSGGGGGGRAGGGAGGGVIELYAKSGNVSILSTAQIRSNGGSNSAISDYPGGGGSGGSIRLVASGNVTNAGIITANGGQGGSTGQVKPADTGGGGAGGRIAFYAGGTYTNTGTVTATGGATGLDGTSPTPLSWARAGADGTIYTTGKPSTLLAASNPIPANGNMFAGTDPNHLSWQPVLGSTTNTVYLGTSLASMALKTTVTNADGMAFRKTYIATLTPGTKYYWRVDTNGVQGPVWTFGTGVCTSPAGDLNGDCRVTFVDFALLASQWKVCNLIPSSGCN
jgi:hypothetical protein